VPAGLLQPDQVYYAELSFTRIVNLYASFLPAVGAGTFVNTTGFLVSTATPAAAPAFTAQPTGQSVTVGATVTFTCAASGNPTPTYQWRKDGLNITGATLASFSLSNVQLSDAASYTVVASNSAGIATSNDATLAVNPVAVAPAFTTQPASQIITAGNPVTFSAAASGTPAPTYQWQKDGVNISGATNSSYPIASVASGDAGNYTVVATNSAGSVTSNPATLTVNPVNVAPAFTTQPASQTISFGSPVAFSAAASGTPTPTYQWQKDGVNIGGATSATFSIASAVPGDAGSYTVVATNSAGTVNSDAALLVLMEAPSNAIVSITVQ
jgi:hypothetical protein